MSTRNNLLLTQATMLAMILINISAQTALAGFPLGTAVTMGGEPVFWIKAPADGFTPEHRAQIAQDNLDNALATAPTCFASLVRIERVNGVLSLTLNGQLVATPDAASARIENLTPDELAQKWANGIKSFLANHLKCLSYRNGLIGIHPIQASIAYTERRLYAPQGTVLPVVLDQALSSEALKAGDLIHGTVSQDVPVGHFIIPQGSVVSGSVVQSEPDQLTVSFAELKTPTGTETPIDASIVTTIIGANIRPHPVCTLSMPAGLRTAARVPAMIAVGVPAKTLTEQLTFVPGSHFKIEAGQQVSVILNVVTPVALVERNMAM